MNKKLEELTDLQLALELEKQREMISRYTNGLNILLTELNKRLSKEEKNEKNNNTPATE